LGKKKQKTKKKNKIWQFIFFLDFFLQLKPTKITSFSILLICEILIVEKKKG